jgi:hypothetical protein
MRVKLEKKTLIEWWNWKQKKLQQKGQEKNLKIKTKMKNKTFEKIVIEELNWTKKTFIKGIRRK